MRPIELRVVRDPDDGAYTFQKCYVDRKEPIPVNGKKEFDFESDDLLVLNDQVADALDRGDIMPNEFDRLQTALCHDPLNDPDN